MIGEGGPRLRFKPLPSRIVGTAIAWNWLRRPFGPERYRPKPRRPAIVTKAPKDEGDRK